MEQTLIRLWGIKCDKCNTMLMFNLSPDLIVCSFCGNHLRTEEAKVPVEVAVDKNCYITPFKVSKEQFRSKMLNWLVDGDYTPDDILHGSDFQETLGIYLPFYYFSINYRGFYQAQVKRYRTETYTEWEDYYDGASNRSRRRPVTKTREVGEWFPVSGQFSGNFTGLGIASLKLPETLASFCENSAPNQNEVKGFDEKHITGFLFEHCSIPFDNVFERRLGERMRKSIDERVNSMIPVNTLIPQLGKQNVKWQVDNTANQINKSLVYLPYWLTTYCYKEKTYQCIIDGQNDNRIEGNKPIDEEKKKKVRSFFYPLIISSASYFVLMITLLIINSNGKLSSAICGYVGLLGLIPIIIFAIIGLIKKHKFLDESRKLRQKILKIVPEITNTNWFNSNDSQK